MNTTDTTQHSPLAEYINKVRDNVRNAITALNDESRPEEIEIELSLDEQGNIANFNSVQVHRARFVVPLNWPDTYEDEGAIPSEAGHKPAKPKKGGK